MKTDRVTGVYQVRIRVAHPHLRYPLPFWFDTVRPGIPPFLLKWSATLLMRGLVQELAPERILFEFGFTRNNSE